ncbi:hypothetical protein PUN28_006372 [Cardiocondyla obscurior]|uniref:Uncharacterized protein n=1 Tax=Cardiocondyla obscurior TaxID=286306 RepID=A0AAW2G8C3_9HYME
MYCVDGFDFYTNNSSNSKNVDFLMFAFLSFVEENICFFFFFFFFCIVFFSWRLQLTILTLTSPL